MNDVVLNELSFCRFREPGRPCAAATRAEARAWMASLVQALAETSRIGFSRSLRTMEEFAYQELAQGYSFVQWRNDPEVNRDERQLFRQYSTKSPLLDGVLDTFRERSRGCEAQFDGIEAKGLLAAYVLDTLATGVPSDPVWGVTRVSVNVAELGIDGDLQQRREVVLHAASPELVRELAPTFQARKRMLAMTGRDLVTQRESLLPNLRFCGKVEETLRGMGQNDERLSWVRRSLFELNDYCSHWAEGEFQHDMLRGQATRESESVRNNAELCALRMFLCEDGQQRYFQWHLKNIHQNLRVHYFPQNDGHIVLVGYIGRHLRTSQY